MECTLEVLNLSKDAITKHLVSGFCLSVYVLGRALALCGGGGGRWGWAGGEGETKISISIHWFSHGQLFFISNTKEVVEQPIL